MHDSPCVAAAAASSPAPATAARTPPDWQPHWTNGLAGLGPQFSTALRPTPLPDPQWVCHSTSVAQMLQIPEQWMQSASALQAFTGNEVLPGSAPLASVYSGHQFGVWAGQLGDGRAILLGEVATADGSGLEVQLKGSGRTPYSRGGDGRAVLRSSIREFLCSEAMHALGIPTTRALALTASPAPVVREEVETAAVVARVAPSFLRFGHFEHFAARDQIDALRTLADYAIDRYYPACRAGLPATTADQVDGNAYAALLQAVSERTADLLAQWQAVGFCHGVMNTDNMSLLGLTIDYGPFQFLDAYDPGHICNHSDSQGRYAFQRQPQVAYWNLFCLGQALLPLIGDEATTVRALESYKARFPAAYLQRMRAKLGLDSAGAPDDAATSALLDPLLRLLAQDRVDYSIFWRRLSEAVAGGDFGPVQDLFLDRAGWQAWMLSYQEQLVQVDTGLTGKNMLKTNPAFVLRNHLGELVIRAAQAGDFQPVQSLHQVLQTPFDAHPDHAEWTGFPPDWASSIAISCSS